MSTTEATEVPAPPAVPSLHVPDEPSALQERWLAAVLAGADLTATLEAPGGLVDWLWERWRVLDAAGVDRPALGTMVVAYRREVWLWLAGERIWEQCCAGLIGRIGRRAGTRPK